MEQRVFCIWIDYRGHHRKGVAFYNATQVNLQQKPWFHWTKNVFFEHDREAQTRKNLLIDIIFAMKKIVMTFSELPSTGLC
jgi:hypothetical protein